MRRQRNLAQMKEQIKTPGKKKKTKNLSEMDIANLSDAELKPLLIRILRECNECGKSLRKEMKATLSETKN